MKMKSVLRDQILAAVNNCKPAVQQIDDVEKIALGHKTEYEMLREFQQTFNSPCNDRPKTIPFNEAPDNDTQNVCSSIRWAMTLAKAESKRTGSQVMFRASLLLEEIAELLEAKNIVEQLDALVDIHYLNTGNFVEIGINPEIPFRIVHDANMSKVWPDGKVHLNEFGKVVKPETFVSPEPLLLKEINRQRTEHRESHKTAL